MRSRSTRRCNGEAPRAEAAHPLRAEHPQDHQDDGARLHVEAQTRAGSRRGPPAVRPGVGRGDRRIVLAGAGGAVPAAAAPGTDPTRWGGAAGRLPGHYVASARTAASPILYDARAPAPATR